ncbi:MAG: hypothetical protein GXP26_08675 [Planctomycetes bacterium]|nr:hypothetical protein [Planctomycetota bacterium]
MMTDRQWEDLLGNIPPRDVLSAGTPADVNQSVARLHDSISDRRRVIISAGGFIPAQFSAEKIASFCGVLAKSV